MLLTQEAAAIQSHAKMFRVFFHFPKRFWPAFDQFSRKAGAIVYNRKEQDVFLYGKSDFYFCSSKARCISNQIFRHIQEYSVVNLERPHVWHRKRNIQSRGK